MSFLSPTQRPPQVHPPNGPKDLPMVRHFEIQKLVNDDSALKEPCFHESGCFAPALKFSSVCADNRLRKMQENLESSA